MDSEDRALLWQDGKMYWCDTGWNRMPQSLNWIGTDGQTGETAVNWPETLTEEVETDPNENAGVSRIEAVVDGHMLVRISGKENRNVRYAMDLADGSAVGRYSLISFEDFLAEKPVYREINTEYIETLWGMF